MNSTDITPIDSIFLLPEEASIGYREIIGQLPRKAKDLLGSDKTGSYITGIAKSYHIDEALRPSLAFSILKVTIGKKQISQLSTTLASELKIPEDMALKMASEIDQDLFAPIQADLDAFWASQKTTTTPHPSPIPASIPKRTDSLPKKNNGNTNRTTTVPTPPTPPLGPRGARNVLDLKELTGRPEQKDLPARPVQKKLASGNRTVDLKSITPHPRPIPEQEGGAAPIPPKRPTPPAPPAPPKPTFPLPPSIRQ